jgi:hypothetical protein
MHPFLLSGGSLTTGEWQRQWSEGMCRPEVCNYFDFGKFRIWMWCLIGESGGPLARCVNRHWINEKPCELRSLFHEIRSCGLHALHRFDRHFGKRLRINLHCIRLKLHVNYISFTYSASRKPPEHIACLNRTFTNPCPNRIPAGPYHLRNIRAYSELVNSYHQEPQGPLLSCSSAKWRAKPPKCTEKVGQNGGQPIAGTITGFWFFSKN